MREYKRQLSEMLEKVEKALDLRESSKTNLFVPVSASLPNQLSTIFLQRIGAALNFSPNEDEKEELGKRLLSPIWSGAAASSQFSSNKSPKNSSLKTESLILAAAAAPATSANNKRFNPIVSL